MSDTRNMVTVTVTHGGGWHEEITTDDPKLLGEWLIYTAHLLPAAEKSLQGNWHVRSWKLDQP